ncbi:MAG: hypothetical protein WB565_16970 [Acidimicrobiales bacterium]
MPLLVSRNIERGAEAVHPLAEEVWRSLDALSLTLVPLLQNQTVITELHILQAHLVSDVSQDVGPRRVSPLFEERIAKGEAGSFADCRVLSVRLCGK